MNDLKTKLTQIVASKPELLKNLNISILQLWHFVDHLIENGIRIPVLCKDCKYWHRDGFCVRRSARRTLADDFCSYGERKDDEEIEETK